MSTRNCRYGYFMAFILKKKMLLETVGMPRISAWVNSKFTC